MLDDLRAHLVELAHRQAAVVGQDERVRGTQPVGQLRDDLLLVFSQHRITSSNESCPPSGRARAEAFDSLGPPRQVLRPEGLPAVFGDGRVDETYVGACSSSSSDAISRVLAGSTWMPGPMELVSVIERM